MATEFGSGCSDVDIPEVSLAEFVLQKAQQYGDKTAWINDNTGESFSFVKLVQLCRRTADNLYHVGLRKGDTVCILSQNCLEYLVAYHAVILRGGIIVSMGLHLTDYEIKLLWEDCKPKFLVTSEVHLTKVNHACSDRLDFLKKVFLITGEADGCLPFSQLYGSCSDAPPVKISPREDVATLNYTSGTTGKAKGVMATHYNYVANICQHGNPDLNFCDADKDNVTGVFRPLFHSYGQIVNFLFTFYEGAIQVLPIVNDFTTLLQTLQKYKITFLAINPLVAKDFAENAELVAQYDTTSLRNLNSGGCVLPVVIRETLQQKFPQVDIRDALGSSECAFMFMPKHGEAIQSIGKPLPNSRAKIVDIDTLQTLPQGKVGELCYQGPNVFPGYYNSPESTKEAFRIPGWYRTGDVAYFDAHGNCHIVDRVKQMIKYVASDIETWKMAPAEIEDVILMHEGVSLVAVVGKPDETYCELPTAFIKCKPDHEVKEEDIHKLVKAHLSPQKWLRGGVYFVSDIPISGSGKVLRRPLRERLVKKRENVSTK